MSIKLEDGIHDIPNDLYHSSSGLSRSALMEFKKSPYHYQQKYLIESEPKEPTPAMILGNAIHTLTLEPDLFDDEFVIMPKMDRRTNMGKVSYNAFQATLAGRICLSQDDHQKAQAVSKAVREHELGGNLLEFMDMERSIYFTHKPTGIQCKSRPDAWKNALVVDLKTTADASVRAFQSSAYKYGYFLQAGMIYSALRSLDIKMERFVFIAVEKEPPYAVGIFILDDEALLWGINQFDALMYKYASCLEKDKWPSYDVSTLSLPKYAINDTNELEID